MGDFDPKEFEPLGIVLRIPVKRRHGLIDGSEGAGPGGHGKKRGGGGAGAGRAQVARIVRRAPEVMVKVSGGARGFKHLREHLNYITRNGRLVAETPDGEIFGRKEVSATAAAWRSNSGQLQDLRQRNSKDSLNLVLSMPAETDRDRFAEAARRFAHRTFAGNHDYLLVEHRDTNHPHVHLTVRRMGHDLTRLNPKKADLQAWREGLALELRQQGIVAEATPRRTRGVVRKPVTQAVKHLDLRGASKVQRAKIEDTVREMLGRVAGGEKPWEQATRKRQALIRDAWTRLADQYEAEGGEGAAMAADIRRFVADMPPVHTERDAIQQAVRAQRVRGSGGADQGKGRAGEKEQGRDEGPER